MKRGIFLVVAMSLLIIPIVYGFDVKRDLFSEKAVEENFIEISIYPESNNLTAHLTKNAKDITFFGEIEISSLNNSIEKANPVEAVISNDDGELLEESFINKIKKWFS